MNSIATATTTHDGSSLRANPVAPKATDSRDLGACAFASFLGRRARRRVRRPFEGGSEGGEQ